MKITSEELNQYLYQPGLIHIDDMAIKVVITNARRRYGHLDLLVTPVSGTGEKWMENHKVVIG